MYTFTWASKNKQRIHLEKSFEMDKITFSYNNSIVSILFEHNKNNYICLFIASQFDKCVSINEFVNMCYNIPYFGIHNCFFDHHESAAYTESNTSHLLDVELFENPNRSTFWYKYHHNDPLLIDTNH